MESQDIAANKKALQMKLEAEALDGWSLLKKSKKSLRLKSTKPLDRMLEDAVWCLFYRMGFSELNEDRQFSIKVGEANGRQLDVFARDDETVFIVLVHHCEKQWPEIRKELDRQDSGNSKRNRTSRA
jgi:DNA sulfur modification protein DndB